MKLVRPTAPQRLTLGAPITVLAPQAQQGLDQATPRRTSTRERLASAFHAAVDAPTPIRPPSPRLTQGHKLRHGTIVKASDPTMAPLLKGTSHGPAQCGRKPGIGSEPATGFLFATLVPKGHPRDPGEVLPLLDKVEAATQRVRTAPKRHGYSVAGDLGVNAASLRQALHARGMLTVGMPKTIEPLQVNPSPAEVRAILHEAG